MTQNREVNPWTVGFDPSVDIDRWAEDKDFEVLAGLHDWIARCVSAGPPDDVWLTELEAGYRFRYWIVDINVTVEFLAVTYERWMLIKQIE